MKDKDKTKGQLLKELSELRKRAVELEKSETERMKAEERLQNLLNYATDGIFAMDLNGVYTQVNQRLVEMHGFSSRDQMLGRNGFEFVAPQDIKRAKAGMKNVLEQKPIFRQEYTALKSNGTVFPIEVSGRLLRDTSEIPIGIIGIARDITERKKAEEKLKTSEERLKMLFEYAPDAYYLNDLKGMLHDGNKAAEELIGYKKEELIGKSFLKLKILSSNQVPKATALLAKNALGKATGPDEFTLRRKDGTQAQAEIRTIPIKIESQPLVLGIARDITERKKSEEQLRESEEKFRNIVELSPDGIIIIDLKGKITTCNPAFLSLTGFSKKEIVGKHFTKLPTLRRKHLKDIPKYIKMFNTILRGEVPQPLEMTWLHKDGSTRLGEFHVSLMKKDRKTIGVQVIARDITERKLTEEALINQNKFNNLRAEIWKKAADPSITDERELIQIILDTVGPVLDVSRTSYLRYVSEKKAYVTELQWKQEEVGSSIGEDISFDIAKQFFGRKCIEIPKDIDKIIKIPGLRRTVKLYVTAKLRKNNIKSYCVVPYGNINNPKGLFTFTECEREREWNVLEKNILTEIVNIITMKAEQIKAGEKIQASLKEKEVLLQEIHHRVKNNMQIISSLIRLQSRHIKNEQALKMFKSTQNRVQSMAIIHERLYKSKDFAKVDFSEYVKSLTGNLISVYGIGTNSIKLHIDIKNVLLDMNTAIPCGLIVNELVSNALKHAFPDGRKGEIKILMNLLNKNEVELIVRDNGIGLPTNVDIKNTKSLGLHLVTILAEDQLHGEIKVDRKRGTSFHLRLGAKQ